MDRASVEAAWKKAGLTQLVAHSALLLQPALRLRPTLISEQAIKVGATKMGGMPDLPADVSWPTYKGIPQAFIAQFKLSDLHAFAIAGQLPAQGMLWFFYDAQQQTYGDAPEGRDGWRVIYRPGSQQLKQSTPPTTLPVNARFKAATLTITPVLTLAQQPPLEVPGLAWSDDDQEKYDTIFQQFYNESDPQAAKHQLLGHPYTLQDDMREQCQLVTNNITDANDPRAATVAQGANAWHLLLQVDSDENLGMQWGSTGIVYYWIKQADLSAQKFEQAWLALQSE